MGATTPTTQKNYVFQKDNFMYVLSNQSLCKYTNRRTTVSTKGV